MADHIIIQARDDIITRLKAGVSAVSNRVYKRSKAVRDADACPYIEVAIDDFDAPEDGGSLNGGSASVPNILQDEIVGFTIRCVVQQDADAEDAAFDLVTAVETALLGTTAGKTLGGLAVDVHRRGGAVEQDDEVALETYAVNLAFKVWLRHLQRLPDSFTY